MPGLHVLIRLKDARAGQAEKQRDTFMTTLGKMKHLANYATRLLIDSGRVMSGFSGYAEYPIKTYDDGNRAIVVEGCIYNKSHDALIQWLSTLVLEEHNLEKELNRFLPEADGEFMIQVYDRRAGLYLVFNDALGWLPIYYRCAEEYIVISREVKFIVPFLDTAAFSREAIAEHLLFCYPLGKHTLLEGVCRFPPATFLLVNVREGSSISRPAVSWNLDPEPLLSRVPDRMLDELVEAFLDALRARKDSFAGYTQMVSLSGGYDSRTVIAGLTKVRANPIGVTILAEGYEWEARIAKEITRCLGVEHRVINIRPSTAQSFEDMRHLAYLKDGLNYVAVSGMLDFYTRVIAQSGTRVLGYTGEGGNRAVDHMGFSPHVNSLRQLASYVYVRDRQLSFREVSLLLDVDEVALRQRFEAHLSSYPERTIEGRYRHFRVFERDVKWNAEGISRNTLFFWHTTPFWAVPFYIKTIGIPDAARSGKKLYRTFLSKINADCAEVTYLGSSRKGRLALHVPMWVWQFAYPALRRAYLRVNAGQGDIEHVRDISLEALDRCETASRYLNVTQARRLIARERGSDKLFVLVTLLLYMELLESNFHPYW